MYLRFFFFSSRRRHTRLQGDWSSDVCSSDLKRIPLAPVGFVFHVRGQTIRSRVERRLERFIGGCVSRLSLRTDIGDCVGGGTKSRARAFCQWLETIITSPQQGSTGSIAADRQPLCELH